MKRWPGALAAMLLFVAGCATPVAPKRAPVVWRETTIGLCEDYPEESRNLVHARADLAAAHAAGAKVLRIAFGWDAMEPTRGAYDWSFWDEFVRMATNDFGLELIPYVCYTPQWAASDPGENFWRSPPRDPADFARFITAIVQRYRGQIHSWELWNEPDNRAYWLGTPEQFAALVVAGSAAVRSADPSARVVLGGIAGEIDFLYAVLRDPKVAGAIDVVNVHSYFETWHPDSVERLPNYLTGASDIIRASGHQLELWMAETGYSSVGARADVSAVYRAHFTDEHTEVAQAAALARTLLTTLGAGNVALFAWYRINDLVSGQDVIGDDNNRHLGLRRVDGSGKPSLATFGRLAKWFAQPFHVLTPTVTIEDQTSSATPEVRAFALRDGRVLVAAWLVMPTTPPPSTPVEDDRRATVRITVPGVRGQNVRWSEAAERPVAPEAASWRPRADAIELTCAISGNRVVIAEIGPPSLVR